ncbi:ABC transporter permease subunit [Halobaculum sp. MBLA0143]|uniref:ABC transporter permease subunit n=1 Tax=Halobaculum sp. MBLA0143 TaxID=3079933 RepID=UPI0035237E07
MSLAAVVRHDLLVVRRSRLAAAVVLVGAVTPVLGSLMEITGSSFAGPEFRSTLLYAWLTVSAVYPVVALACTVGAVAGERETGALRMIGGLPTTRVTLFTGKALARTAVVVTGVVAGLAGLAVVLWLVFEPTAIAGRRVAGFCLFTLLVVVCYAALGMAVSGSVETRGRAVGLAVAVLALTIAWPAVVDGLSGVLPFGSTTQQFVGTLSPFGAYAQAISDEQALLAVAVDTPLLGTGVNAAIICAWMVGALAVGRRQFRVSEL